MLSVSCSSSPISYPLSLVPVVPQEIGKEIFFLMGPLAAMNCTESKQRFERWSLVCTEWRDALESQIPQLEERFPGLLESRELWRVQQRFPHLYMMSEPTIVDLPKKKKSRLKKIASTCKQMVHSSKKPSFIEKSDPSAYLRMLLTKITEINSFYQMAQRSVGDLFVLEMLESSCSGFIHYRLQNEILLQLLLNPENEDQVLNVLYAIQNPQYQTCCIDLIKSLVQGPVAQGQALLHRHPKLDSDQMLDIFKLLVMIFQLNQCFQEGQENNGLQAKLLRCLGEVQGTWSIKAIFLEIGQAIQDPTLQELFCKSII